MQPEFVLKVHKPAGKLYIPQVDCYELFTCGFGRDTSPGEALCFSSGRTVQVHLLRHLRKLGNFGPSV